VRASIKAGKPMRIEVLSQPMRVMFEAIGLR
jgi:hypothetical protein